MNCLFCKIAQGEIPCSKVLEDKENLAFLDIKPHALGHTVVIPKAHAETVFEVDEQKLKHLFSFVKKVMEKLQQRVAPDGFNVGWNHLEAGGQVVPHLHIHILPRFKGDGGGSMHSIMKNPSLKSVEEVEAVKMKKKSWMNFIVEVQMLIRESYDIARGKDQFEELFLAYWRSNKNRIARECPFGEKKGEEAFEKITFMLQRWTDKFEEMTGQQLEITLIRIRFLAELQVILKKIGDDYSKT